MVAVAACKEIFSLEKATPASFLRVILRVGKVPPFPRRHKNEYKGGGGGTGTSQQARNRMDGWVCIQRGGGGGGLFVIHGQQTSELL